MPLGLEIKKEFEQTSDIVKSVDLHPTEPWILTSLNSGTVCIWHYPSKTVVRSFEVTELPVGSAKFIARKKWVVAGADDKCIHLYNYNNGHKVKEFEAHTGFIRSVAVHAILPYVLSSSDDMLIKLWDWEKGWALTRTFGGHSGCVMQVTFNPKDVNAFASASLDSTIKIWNIGKNIPTCTLSGHDKGVKCVGYFPGDSTTYLITGSDDCTAKVWDYWRMSCVRTLEGHAHNVSAVCFHPVLPIIITGSEDGRVCIWHSTSYRLENTLTHGLERVSAFSYLSGSRRFLIGYDRGTIMVNLGSEAPVASMDRSGKIIWSKHEKIQTVKVLSVKHHDGERLPFSVKNLDIDCQYPQSLKHSPNGQWVVVCGDDEYTIYRASKWEYKLSGPAFEFVWSLEGEYAVWGNNSTFKIFTEDGQEKRSIIADFSAEHIYGGNLLAICSKSFICFYDWTECRLIRRIDLNVKNLYWAPRGEYMAIVSDTSCRILKYNRDIVSAYLGSGRLVNEQGIDNAFEELYAFEDQVMAGFWYESSFVYTNSSWRLNFCLNGEVTEIYHLDCPMYMLGFVTDESCVYLIDKEYKYTLPLDLIAFKYYAMRDDTEEAHQCLQNIPKQHNNSVAHIFEALGKLVPALYYARDPVYKAKLVNELRKQMQIPIEVDPVDPVDEPIPIEVDPVLQKLRDQDLAQLQELRDQEFAEDITFKDQTYGDSMRSTDTVHTILKWEADDGKVYLHAREVDILVPVHWAEEVVDSAERRVKMHHLPTKVDYDMVFIPIGDGTYSIGGRGWEEFYATITTAAGDPNRFWFRKTGKRIPLISLAARDDALVLDGVHTMNAPSSSSSSASSNSDADPNVDVARPDFFKDMDL